MIFVLITSVKLKNKYEGFLNLILKHFEIWKTFLFKILYLGLRY